MRVTQYTMICFAILVLSATHVSGGLISEADIIANWTDEADFITDGNSANWSSSGNVISSGGNTTGALVSDFTATGNWSFSTKIQASGDNDLMGVVFGWQDISNTYGLVWGGGGLGPFNGIRLIKQVGGVNTDLASSGLIWTGGVTYDFNVSRSGNDISASITQGATPIFSTTITDSQFLTGKVGFDVWSQTANFSFGDTDFTQHQVSAVPEPSSLVLFGLGTVGMVLAVSYRSRKQAA